MSKTFLCPHCTGYTVVKDSRAAGNGVEGIRRRRQCEMCGSRFSTIEHEIEEAPQGYLEMLAKLQLGLDTVQSALTALQGQTKTYTDAASFLHDVKYGNAANRQEKT